MPRLGCHGLGPLIAFVLTVILSPAYPLSACPDGLPSEPVFHAPIAQLAPVASELVEIIAGNAYQERPTKNPETRNIKDVQLDLSIKYNFRIYTPLTAIPMHLRNAFVAAEEAPAAADVDDIKRRHTDCIETEFLKVLFEGVLDSQRRARGLVHPAILQVLRWIHPEGLDHDYKEILLSRYHIKRPGNEQIIAFLVVKAENISVEQLSELAFNLPYFGAGSYGVTAAAVNYFSKPLDDLTLAEAAFLAGLPKAPNNYHPVRRTQKAVERRNWVIERMLAQGFISSTEAEIAKAEAFKVTLQ
jgi:hypothetical protein